MMSNLSYQSHEKGSAAQVDSFKRLDRLRIPASLKGSNVLDIGCNEGFFCNQAIDRGASKVVGIDGDSGVIERAKERYRDDRILFLNQTWRMLPEGEFDLVLWTSAMHYELDPISVLTQIASRLSDNGLFILECGVHPHGGKDMIRSIRHDGSLWYPTIEYLESAFATSGLAYRYVGQPELIGADPVPRSVFHCNRIRTSVLLLNGPSGAGKSYLAHQLKTAATKVISLDWFVARIYHSKYKHTRLEKFICENTDRNDLSRLYNSIDENGFTEEYVAEVVRSIAKSDHLVVIEGYMTPNQQNAFKKILSKLANVWTVNK